ncbi:MAG: precorrin-3B synthase [Hyphomicrobiales bacterium]|nr:precorrin-3B synthase [Hyphomicrobiales bacterium]
MAECPGVFKLSETRDGGLARIRVPGGLLTSAQLTTVADLARDRGNGLIDLTHRANLQVRGLGTEGSPKFCDALQHVGLLAADPVADRLRNILASPLAGLDSDEIIDVRPCVAALDQALQSDPGLGGLSPKFSFVFDGGGVGRVGALSHDVGFLAETTSEGVRLRLSLAGRPTAAMIAPADASALAVALAKTAIHLSSDDAARMSTALANHSVAEVLDHARRQQTDIDISHQDPTPRPIVLEPVLGPVCDARNVDIAYGLGIPLGRLTDATARALAALAENFGDGLVRLAPWQAVFITGLPTQAVDAVRSEAHALGLLTEPEDIAIRVSACSGSTGCMRTECDTKADGSAVLAALRRIDAANRAPMTIHLSGCARGCAHPDASRLLLLGRPDGGYDAFRDARPSSSATSDPFADRIRPDRVADFVIEFANG